MTEFYKLSGAGNDFLALVEPEDEPRPEAIRSWCARGLSIGADGLFTLSRAGDGAARMIHYNADGGRAELCVNGTRCAAQLAFHLGWAERSIDVDTDSGRIAASATSDTEVSLALPAPTETPAEMSLELESGPVTGWRLRVGGPHFVIARDETLATAPVADLGPALRAHPDLGKAGANVHWCRFLGRRRLAIRSFERGVEAETLACGSGVLAATAVGIAHFGLQLPTEAITGGGFAFTVDGEIADGAPIAWTLAGDARILARGELLSGSSALREPDPARHRELTSGE